MRLDEVLRVPEGKFRVFGRDNFDNEYFLNDKLGFLYGLPVHFLGSRARR